MPEEIKQKCYKCDGIGTFMTSGGTSTPRTINCKACGGKGYIVKEILYTQTEQNKAVQDEREACALVCEKLSYKDLN